MTENTGSREIITGGANYLGWRGELLAQLALARVPELSVHKPKENCGYDFLVATPSGVCFFVMVKAFSSKKLGIDDVDQVADLSLRIKIDNIQRARDAQTPVFVFLIDADTDHGRYIRLDAVDVRNRSSQTQLIRFPRENTIHKKGIEAIVATLEKCEKAVSG